VIEAIPDNIVLKDGQGRWLIVNEQAKRHYRLQNVPWYGKTQREIAEYCPEHRPAFEASLAHDEDT
jgi:hypothetical protein